MRLSLRDITLRNPLTIRVYFVSTQVPLTACAWREYFEAHGLMRSSRLCGLFVWSLEEAREVQRLLSTITPFVWEASTKGYAIEE